MDKKKMFWEDVQQARDRLEGSWILYDNQPVSVSSVGQRDEGPSAQCLCPKTGKVTWRLLTDPAFGDFHRLPPLGYVNLVRPGKPTAVYLTRVPDRSRLHGLRSNKVTLHELTPMGLVACSGKYPLEVIFADRGYDYRVADVYPDATEVIEKLPEGCSAAIDSRYAIAKDSFGLCRLYRRQACVGLLNENGLRLSRNSEFYKEEISEIPAFNVNLIEVAA